MIIFLLGLLLVFDVGAQAQNCQTPSGQPGYCVLLNQCPFMLNYLNSVGRDSNSPEYLRATEYLRASTCVFMGKQSTICCNQPVYQNTGPPDVSNHRNVQLLEHDKCGLYTADKIIDGETTEIFEFPWMALLGQQHRDGGNIAFFCGGTIINRRYVLTAAHCIRAIPQNYFLREVRLGEHDTNTLNDCGIRGYQNVCTEGFQSFGVESISVHNDFLMETLQNDIALLRLNTDIEFNLPNVKPICLPIGTAGRLLEQQGIVTGWGKTRISPVSTKLLKAKIPIVPNNECSRYFNYTNYKQICAGGQGEFDSCTGDSGGPLQNIGNYYNSLRVVQYGLISYGPRRCGMNGVPSVYTSIPYYMDWILNNMR